MVTVTNQSLSEKEIVGLSFQLLRRAASLYPTHKAIGVGQWRSHELAALPDEILRYFLAYQIGPELQGIFRYPHREVVAPIILKGHSGT